MPVDAPDLASANLLVERLLPEHAGDLEGFCDRCESFFELITGERDASARAAALLTGRPPGITLEHKFVFGILRGAELVAVVDLLEGFPVVSEWYVGLLLVLPEMRQQKVGSAIWQAMESWVRSRGARCARLLVQDQNPRAARFWRSHGFFDEVRVTQRMTSRTNNCWQLAKRYDASAEERDTTLGFGERAR